MVDISIIVVNYNGKKYLKDFFEALIAMDKGNLSIEIVFVDNASLDGSADYIKERGYDHKLPIIIVENSENQGFALGNNTGVNISNGKYVVFLNNDTSVCKEWLVNLYRFYLRHDDCGSVGSKLLFFYDFIGVSFKTVEKIIIDPLISVNDDVYKVDARFSKNILQGEEIVCFGHTVLSIPLLQGDGAYTFGFTVLKCDDKTDRIVINDADFPIHVGENIISFDTQNIIKMKYRIIQNAGSAVNQNYEGFDIGMGEIDRGQYDEERVTDNGCGAALMIEKSLFDSIGGFDERFFMYYEDTDLSFRIRKTGKKVYYCPDAVVRHIHTGSSGEWSPFFTYHVYRNWLVFIYKNISKWTYLKKSIRLLLSAIKHKDKLRLVCVRDAFLMELMGRECRYRG